MKRHVASTHNLEAKAHRNIPLWKECKLQTYFTGKGRIDYFVVVDNINGKSSFTLDLATLLKEEEKDLFIKLENDY